MQMKVEVENFSTHTIKPSSPTLDHLRKHQLSILDQGFDPVYIHFVLFYPGDHNNLSNSETSNQLKRSLSKALVVFYPLAGRLVDNSYVDCNDEGVLFVEARVAGCTLSDVTRGAIPGDEIYKFHPCDLADAKEFIMAVQVNFFDCGGLALGIGVSHKIADASSFVLFINAWAAISLGKSDIPSPKFEFANLFPPKNVSSQNEDRVSAKMEEMETKRFVFSASKIDALRDKCTINEANPESSKRPTRVEALSAFIWSRLIASTQETAGSNKIYNFISHAVNLRTRTNPTFSDHYFGNMSWHVVVLWPLLKDAKECFGFLDKLIREAVHNVNGDFVAKLKQGEETFNFKKNFENFKEVDQIISFHFTSLCRFPIYEADFGWGKPTWAPFPPPKINNLVILQDKPSVAGIEIWINLKKKDMVKFADDMEFLSYISSGLDVEK